MSHPLLADPVVSDLPVRECGEPLVDLRDFGILCMNPGDVGGMRVRSSLGERLGKAQGALPDGIRFGVAQGHRSPEAQNEIIATYSDSLRLLHPDKDETEIARLSSRFVAPIAVAPHVAGAAVDLTLVDGRGQPLWMGTPIDATPEQSDGACYFDAPGIDSVARRNREIMADALGGHGLVNYPTEWWHWSYGDRYWAYVTSSPHAIYGPWPASGATA
ncbi:M15 family metallopeptidase [Marinactinospora rubrisoli]|uniref:M15 family metallopeptidase n=1 Tax=Marinactinospora rubrisoli TaxID=2715399 RepID=A0ABW2KKA5_9ACTN